MTILEHRPDDFATRNLFLHALLGVRAWGSRMERLCAAPGDQTLDENEPIVLAALGAIAFARSADNVLTRALSEPPPCDAAQPHAPDVTLSGSLLR